MSGPAGSCSLQDLSCQAYNWGWNASLYDASIVAQTSARATVWWLDVETANGWCGSDPPACSPNGLHQNDRVIQGMIDGLRSQGALPGIYGTAYQFDLIAGPSYLPVVPLWVAGARDGASAPAHCSPAFAFASGQVWLAQWTGPIAGGAIYDQDYAC